jgi:hypothetical protein
MQSLDRFGMISARHSALVAFVTILLGCGNGGGNNDPAELHFEEVQAVSLGGGTDVCIAMTGGRERIAGLQMNLHWDDTSRRLCRANPATGKAVQSALQGRGVLKAILISFSDVEPIPDGQLFCCGFVAVGDPGGQCVVEVTQIIGSSPTGTRIDGFEVTNQAVVDIDRLIAIP